MQNPYLRLAGFAFAIKKEFSRKVLLGILVLCFSITQAFFLAYGTQEVFRGENKERILLFFLLAGGCILCRSLLAWYTEVYTKEIAGKVKTVLRKVLVEKLIDLGPAYQSVKRSGRLQSLVTDGVEYVEPFLVLYLPQLVVVVISSLCIGLYICSLNWIVGTIVLIAMLVAVVMPYFMMPFIKKAAMEYWQGYAVLNAQYVDAMQGMNTLKSLGAAERKGQELHDSAERFRRRQIRWTAFSLVSSAIIVLMMAVGKYLTVGAATLEMAQGMLAEGYLFVILYLVVECMRPIVELDAAWHASYMGLSVSHELFEILDEPIVVREAKDPKNQGISEQPVIEFQEVSFRYPNRSAYALEKVSFIIPAGETVAFVGRSGSGKSTLTNLLLRFYDVTEGAILIDGTDVREFSLAYLRSRMAVVFQDTYLFYGSVKDNLILAARKKEESNLAEAAQLASAHEFIEQMPRQYDTLVGERGVLLSGGEKQRIAIARAILKEAPVLIFDEATSSVDAFHENKIQHTVHQISKKCTTIIIAHRLSTIRYANSILVLDQGRVVERGRHEDLLCLGGVYTELVEAQTSMEG